MTIALNQLGQVSLSVDDVDAAEEFFGQKLGLRKLYRFGDLVFFDCAGVRLFLEKVAVPAVRAEWIRSLLSHAGHHHNGPRA